MGSLGLVVTLCCLLCHIDLGSASENASASGNASGLDDGSEFALNVFSDIAPIVSLFGEQFATQFLSQSMGWSDHVIFACVPVGIVTTILGVIRVSGPNFVKAFIGRVRENRAAVELEFMSSISNEVCEMFNDSAIVRAMGKPRIGHFLIFPPRVWDYKSLDLRIHTLRSAVKEGLILAGNRAEPSGLLRTDRQDQADLERANARPNSPDVAPSPRQSTEGKATYTASVDTDSNQEAMEPLGLLDLPNIHLNLQSGDTATPDKRKASKFLALLSLLIQGGLMGIAGIAELNSVQESTGFTPKRYASPCYIVGSFTLCIGVGLCSFVIERSTIENHWAIKEERHLQDNPAHLIFIQPEQKVQDMDFSATAIFAGRKASLVTSRRSPELSAQFSVTSHQGVRQPRTPHPQLSRCIITQPTKSQKQKGSRFSALRVFKNRWEFRSVAGAVLTACGFVVQYIGLRGLPYPCAVAHLGGIFLLAFLRALLRRRLGHVPSTSKAISSHELDFLAFHVVFCLKCNSGNGNAGTGVDFSETDEHIDHDSVAELLAKWKPKTPYPETDTEPREQPDKPSRTLSRTAMPPYLSPETSRVLLNVRKRMSDLCQWNSPILEAALILARSVELFANTFLDEVYTDTLLWRVDLGLPSTDVESESYIDIQLQKRGGDSPGAKKQWSVDSGEIEAIMSMWMAAITTSREDDKGNQHLDWRRVAVEKGGSKMRYIQVLGADQHGCMRRDLEWWVEDHPPLQTRRDNEFRGDDFVIGFDGSNDGTRDKEIYRVRQATLPIILARHLFTTFVWAMSKRIPRDLLRRDDSQISLIGQLDVKSHISTTDASEAFHSPLIRHQKISDFVNEVASIGLDDAKDLSLCIIPTLTHQDLLPNHKFLDEFVPKFLDLGITDLASFCYNMVAGTWFRLDIFSPEQFALDVLARAFDFIQLASEPYHEIGFHRMDAELDICFRTLLIIMGKPIFNNIIGIIEPILIVQCRKDRIETVVRYFLSRNTLFGGYGSSAQGIMGPIPHIAKLTRHSKFLATQFGGFHKTYFDLAGANPRTECGNYSDEELRHKDIFGWTFGHYQVLFSSDRFRGRTAPLQVYRVSPKDNIGRSPVHVAMRGGNSVELFRYHFNFIPDTDLQRKALSKHAGLDGLTPLHLAMQYQNPKGAVVFSRNFSRFHSPRQYSIWAEDAWNQVDRWGRNPAHIAAIHDPLGSAFKILRARYGRADVLDHFGNSPLSYLCLVIDRQFPRGFAFSESFDSFCSIFRDIKYKDTQGRTKWHIAALYLDDAWFRILNPTVEDLSVSDYEGLTPLDRAISVRNTDVVSYIKSMKQAARLRDIIATRAATQNPLTTLLYACFAEP